VPISEVISTPPNRRWRWAWNTPVISNTQS